MYTYQQALEASIKYFGGEELPAKVFVDKYAMRNHENQLVELTPDDTHRRLAKEFARVEKTKFKKPYTEEEIFELFKHFRYIIPQGSPLMGIGNNYQTVSISNCFVVPSPEDSYGGILKTDQHIAQISKRRGGIGFDISTLRPSGSYVKNAASTTTGGVSFMHRFSNTCREVCQCIEENQLVLSDSGWKKIKNINHIDKVWTKNGWVKVSRTVFTGNKDVYKVTSKFGNIIITSKDHIFQTFNNDGLTESRLESLKVGDSIVGIFGNHTKYNGNNQLMYSDYTNVNNKPKNCDLPTELNSDIGYLLGYSYGDGYVESNHRILELACSNDYPNIKTKLNNIIINNFNYTPIFSDGDGDLENLCINNKTIVEFLNYNNILKQKSGEISFPDKIVNADSSVQLAFIAGYFDADGSCNGSKCPYKFNSISLQFINKLQVILNGFGILSKISSENRDDVGWNTLYTLAISGTHSTSRFSSLIGAYSEKVKLKTFISKKDNYLSPFHAKYFGIKYNNYSFVPDNTQFLSINTLNKLNIDNYLYQDQIQSIEYVGKANTYDLMLESEHLFNCNGYYVHNSGRRGAEMMTLSVHYPDILDFVKIKSDGVSVTGANISVRLTNEFLKAVKQDKDYELRWPVDSDTPLVSKQVNARKVWKEIIHHAWLRAEPGLLFWDNILENSPADCYGKFNFNTVATNPCCFSSKENIYVITNNGIKEIKEVTSNDKIWINESKSWAKTSGYFNAGKAKIYKVSFKNGEDLFITNNHKLCVVKNERIGTKVIHHEGELVPLSELSVGSKIYTHTTKVDEIVFGQYGNYEEGLIIGSMTGDGCLSYRSKDDRFPATILDFWSQDYETAKECEKAFNSLGYKISLQKSSCVEGKNRLCSETFTKDFVQKYKNNIWLFKSDTEINPFLFKASKKFIIGYLQTYFAANGTVQYVPQTSYYSVSLASINKNRLKQAKYLLSLFGIKSSISIMKKAGENIINGVSYNTKDCWRLVLTGIDNLKKFANEIGILNHNKQLQLQKICNVNQHHQTKNLAYTEISNIEEYSEDDVGCIEVEQYHKFTANGIISGNSEITLSAFDSCRLMAINLFNFVKNPFTKHASFDFVKFGYIAEIAQRLMDDMIDLEAEKIKSIISKIESDGEDASTKATELELWQNILKYCLLGRRTGLGITGLGDTLAALNIKYGSDQSIKTTESIYETLKIHAYKSSIEMAEELGPFPIFDHNLEKDCKFFKSFPKDILKKMELTGRRNIAILTTAPTGTISMLAAVGPYHNVSSGIEPVFMLSYTRRKKGNPGDKNFRSDFVDKSGDHWMEFPVYHNGLKLWMEITGETDITKSPYYGYCAEQINWVNRVKLQAAAQKHIDHAISSTINLPEDVTEEEVAKIYETAWEAGCKGITVYRANCRTGVLVDTSKKKENSIEIIKTTAPKRPKELEADVHHITVNQQPYLVVIGLLNGQPYEVFSTKNNLVDKTVKRAKIVKVKKSIYKAIFDDETELSPINHGCDEYEDGLTRMISCGLRHGADIQFLSEQLSKTRGNINSFAKSIARALKNYIKDGTTTKEKCSDCGGNLIYQEGCMKCSCGYSKCN